MSRFYELDPSIENYWRAIILFGRNSASYKFALAKSLYDLHESGNTYITLEDLALPYTKHLYERIKTHPKQVTRDQSTFLDNLRRFNEGKINHDEMIKQSVRYGFNNVIDAFHIVHGNEVGIRFFTDERKTNGGIRLTDHFFKLGENFQFGNLQKETESRWRLVETAWENNISKKIILVEYEESSKNLIIENPLKRVSVTSARPALNGYQKGRCFYCFKDISVEPFHNDLADVDHFFPHILKKCDTTKPIDGISNLVLACRDCNRGENGKFERLPSIDLLDRLFNRNEYLITSHHPLRETLIAQTGITSSKRQNYLQAAYNCSSLAISVKQKWHPKPQGNPVF